MQGLNQHSRAGTDPVSAPTQRFVRMTARVRSLAVTRDGRLSCLFDGEAGTVRAMSDMPVVHLPELRKGCMCELALLRVTREVQGIVYDWQLLGCRGGDTGRTNSELADGQGDLA